MQQLKLKACLRRSLILLSDEIQDFYFASGVGLWGGDCRAKIRRHRQWDVHQMYSE